MKILDRAIELAPAGAFLVLLLFVTWFFGPCVVEERRRLASTVRLESARAEATRAAFGFPKPKGTPEASKSGSAK